MVTHPPFKGGQGRSDESVREDAVPLLVGGAVLFCVIAWALILWLCV